MFQSAVRIAVSLKVDATAETTDLMVFQSAVRIAVSLKAVGNVEHAGKDGVSIRRADRCLAEVGQALPVRVIDAVSIRRADRCLAEEVGQRQTWAQRRVSIRRADRCLAEDLAPGGKQHQRGVSIRRADRCLAEALPRRYSARVTGGVSIRRADRCLAEDGAVPSIPVVMAAFQSAVRIAVSLKGASGRCRLRVLVGFNPPCGSLSR